VTAIEVVRHPRARRAKLSFDRISGRARLTIPQRASESKALAWAATQREWLEAQRARLPEERPFTDGAVIPFEDAELTITWTEGSSRIARREGDRLHVSGPPEYLARRVETWLRREALRLLSEDTARYATLARVSVPQVAIGDARGRWGSCSSVGAIRYSWRLVLAPSAVRRATAAHEVAHRVHMNHAPAFHALVAELYGADPAPQRRWLKEHGASLHWFGRGSA
jgi:predicted metal-dependent hydrolase